MQIAKISQSVMTASITVVGLILLLLLMASVSGGFVGLSGLSETMAYSVVVMIPLLLVVLVAAKKSEKEPKRVVVLAPSADRSTNRN